MSNETSRPALTRRGLLQAGAAAGLASLLPVTATDAAEPKPGAFTFIQVNDLHYHEPACGEWFAKVVPAMKQSAPDLDFALLCGDQADEGKLEQMTAVRDLFKGLGVPLYAVIGNHDHLTDTDRSAYEAVFPDQLNYHFEHKGWQLIGLDTSDGTHYHDTHVSKVTLQWLDDNLPKLDARQPTIVFTHFPLAKGVTNRPLNADEVLDRFANFNLQAVFGGHWHGLSERAFHDAILTTDRCCSRFRDNHDGSPHKGWFVCEVRGGTLTRRFVDAPPVVKG